MACLDEQAAEALGLGALFTNSAGAEADVGDGRVLLKGRSQGLEMGCRA